MICDCFCVFDLVLKKCVKFDRKDGKIKEKSCKIKLVREAFSDIFTWNGLGLPLFSFPEPFFPLPLDSLASEAAASSFLDFFFGFFSFGGGFGLLPPLQHVLSGILRGFLIVGNKVLRDFEV